MESIYLNGGMNGVTLDFADTDRYVTGTTAPSISFLTSQSYSGTTDITLPTITSDNALVVILSGSVVNPVYGKRMITSGWDLAVVAEAAGGDDDVMAIIYYKKCTTADSGITISYDTINRHIVAIFDIGDDYDVTVGSTNSQAARSNPLVQTISMSGLTTPVIGLGMLSSNGVISPRTYSLGSPDEELALTTYNYAPYWIFNSSPGDRSIDMDDEGRQAMASCYLQISPTSTFGNQKNSGIWALQSAYDALVAAILPIYSYRYYRWDITAIRGGGGDSYVQAADFYFTLNGSDVTMSGSTATNVAGSSPGAEDPSNLVDSNSSTKWLNLSGVSGDIQIDFGSVTDVNGYRWVTANDNESRDPISWVLQGSNDGTNWEDLDTRTSESITTSRFTSTSIYEIQGA